MKFIKQNILIFAVLVLLIICILKLNDLQVKYNELNTKYSMLNSSIESLPANFSYKQERVAVKEVMTLMEVADYIGVEWSQLYSIIKEDKTIPYVMINNQYRFNKTAIDNWMSGQRKLEGK